MGYTKEHIQEALADLPVGEAFTDPLLISLDYHYSEALGRQLLAALYLEENEHV